MKKKLILQLPEGFIDAVNRRHHGRVLPMIDRVNLISEMNNLYSEYQKVIKKYDYCGGDWWDENKIESHVFSQKWYYAHRKLKKLENIKNELHQKMFYVLLSADGNYETFDKYSCISANEIFEDFNSKYNKKYENSI